MKLGEFQNWFKLRIHPDQVALNFSVLKAMNPQRKSGDGDFGDSELPTDGKTHDISIAIFRFANC